MIAWSDNSLNVEIEYRAERAKAASGYIGTSRRAAARRRWWQQVGGQTAKSGKEQARDDGRARVLPRVA